MADPIRAVTMEHPGQVYASLDATKTLTWNDLHRLWVAAHPNVVREVLEHPDCVVRPRNDRVPEALAGSRAGQIFGQLARMTEGKHHDRARQAIADAVAAIDPELVRTAARRAATMALGSQDGARFPFDCSQYTLGLLFGVTDDQLAELAALAGRFARCLAPGADDTEIAGGIAAADHLWQTMSELVTGREPGRLTIEMQHTLSSQGLGHDALVANMIGLLFQAHDAVAGLIGNAVVSLAWGNGSAGASLRSLVTEVAHADPSIQNTRRFVERDTVIDGQPVRAGDAILLVLATDGGSCPFGHGRHACPGQEIAITIAEEAVAEVVRRGAVPASIGQGVTYRPSANARIPEIEYVPAGEVSE